MTEILQILPRVPPAVCGVGDYAWNLAGKLQNEQGIRSSFLAAEPSPSPSDSAAPFKVWRLESRSAERLVHFVAASDVPYDALVLHYSGYGFAPRGAPRWLAQALAKIRQLPNRPGIVTMFHELHASGSIRSSAFWLQPLQRAVVKSIARASDFLRTNREHYASQLKRMIPTRDGEVSVMPVFSNLGESEHPRPLTERRPQMVVFSSSLQGSDRIRQVQGTAEKLCMSFGLSRLHLVGRHWEDSALQHKIEVLRHPFLSVDQAATLLSDSRIGYVVYPPDYLGKSTLFAALAAHGLAVVTLGENPVLPEGLREGAEVLHERAILNGGAPDMGVLQKLADGLHAWYQSHTVSRTAANYARDVSASLKIAAG